MASDTTTTSTMTAWAFRGWFDENTVVEEIEQVVTHAVGHRWRF